MQIEIVEIRDHLARFPPFDSLPEDTLNSIATQVEVAYFKAGTEILEYGAAIHDLHYLRSGAVEIYRRSGELYNRLSEGDIFGQVGLLRSNKVRFPATAIEDSLVYFIPEATFTQQAALRKFGNSLKYSATRTIAEVFQEVSRGRADYGVVPVENSSEGVVTNTLDVFVDSPLKIVAQIVLPIQQCLVGKGKREQIKKLYVHPQSLAQCRGWIQKHLPDAEIVETSSNARSAQLAAGPSPCSTKSMVSSLSSSS